MNRAFFWKKVLAPPTWWALMTVMVFLTAPAPAPAATHPVSPGGSIQAAIDRAANGDAIELLAGTHTVSSEIQVNGKDLTILGDDAEGATVVQGDGGCRVFSLTNATATLENLTVTKGDTWGGNGAGIKQDGGSLTLKNCVVTQNGSEETIFGGGVSVSNGTLLVTSCTIEKNSAWGGAGIHGEESSLNIMDTTIQGNNCLEGPIVFFLGGGVLATYSDLTIADSTIQGNYSSFGGGLGAALSSLTVTDTVITGNSSLYDGGGAMLLVSSGSISSSSISNNRALTADDAFGGGLLVVEGSSLAIDDSTISGNKAGFDGGGIYLYGSRCTLSSSTVSNNHAGTEPDTWGGGINVGSGSTLTVSDSTISGNSSTGSGGGIWMDGLFSSLTATARLNTEMWAEAFPAKGTEKATPNSSLLGGTSLTMDNSTVSGNTAAEDGGGLAISGTAYINFSTITGNTADLGGGINHDPYSTVYLGSSIVAGNTAVSGGPDWYEDGQYVSRGGNLVGNNTDSDFTQGSPNSEGDYVGGSASPMDPLLGDLADNGGPTQTHALLSDSSPAVDHALTCVDRDQRGYARPYPVDGACDIGAFEFYGLSDLTLTKTVDNPTPLVGSQIAYFLTVTNNGPDQGVGVTVKDRLPEGLTYVSDDSGGSYNPETGLWTIGVMDVSASNRLQINATVNRTGTITNTATAGAAKTDPTPATASVDIQAITEQGAVLELTKTVDNASPWVLSQVAFTLTVTNLGPETGLGVTVTDLLPAGLTYVSDDSGGSYNAETGLWTIGDLDLSGTGQLVITARVTGAGLITNTATASSETPGSTPATASVELQVQNQSGGGGGGGGCFIQSLW